MAVYTVMLPPAAGDPAGEAEDAVFLKDGFSWWAFLVPVVWPLFYGLWLVFAAVLVLSVTLELVAYKFGGPLPGVIGFLLSALFALEANTLRGWTLARRGWRFAGVVAGKGDDEMERRFFASLAAGEVTPQIVSRPQRRYQPAADSETVLGLFPTPEGKS
ncbi:MAG: hypothetical protein C0606_07075 [Hyphomicrobiales bacterium]|nr:MAG: hypothetical protein C0606_07075 [Hyphomicrobiales bacterium]